MRRSIKEGNADFDCPVRHFLMGKPRLIARLASELSEVRIIGMPRNDSKVPRLSLECPPMSLEMSADVRSGAIFWHLYLSGASCVSPGETSNLSITSVENTAHFRRHRRNQ